MATDYEQFYRDNPHGLGQPTAEFLTFFQNYTTESSKVLDVGCGQGRDALFIARLGHHVTAVDYSPTGVGALDLEAKTEGLNVVCVVADIRDYDWRGQFDVIVVDRTLHMLSSEARVDVLKGLLNVTKTGTHVLIADERSNISEIGRVFEESDWEWATTLARKGFLFMVRQ